MPHFDDINNEHKSNADYFDTTEDDAFTVEYRHIHMLMYSLIFFSCLTIVGFLLIAIRQRHIKQQQSLLGKKKKEE